MSIKEIIASRRTSKVLAKTPLEAEYDHALLESLVNAAAYAPFHYMASSSHREKLPDKAPEPWRVYILNRAVCREVRKWLMAKDDKTKVPEMLAAADMLLQVTWCPATENESEADMGHGVFAASLTNMEHIAATAAAIQNIILTATEHDIPNYWSSGGFLRTAEAFELLGIPQDQILLGSVFFFPCNVSANPKVAMFPGKMRDRRSFGRSWCQKVGKLNYGSGNDSATGEQVNAVVRMRQNLRSLTGL